MRAFGLERDLWGVLTVLVKSIDERNRPDRNNWIHL